MNLGWGIIAGLSLLIASTRTVPTASDIQWWFEEGQKFYASGAYDQAVEKYTSVIGVKSRLLETSKLEYLVGEITAPVQEIALYQTGNSYFKMAQEEESAVRRARNEKQRQNHRERADEFRMLAVKNFEKTEEHTGITNLRELARNRIVKVWYEAGAYERTIQGARRLIEQYPQSTYVKSALYDIGWSHYHLGQYEQSLEAFKRLVDRFPSGYQHDRALFQIGESYFNEEKYREALPYYQRLVERAQIDQLTDSELARMRREKIAGLVDETKLELAMKSQIRMGACHAGLEDYERASQMYRSVIGLFTKESRLAEEAYRRLAEMYFKAEQFERGMAIYREAIESVSEPPFRARMQSMLAEQYFQNGRYEEAILEYRLFMEAYAEVPSRAAGFGVDEAQYKIGQAYYELGRGDQENEQAALMNLVKAVDAYEAVLEKFVTSRLLLACHFNIGLTYQIMDTAESRARALEKYRGIVRENPEDDYAPGALFQIARMQFSQESLTDAIATYERIIADYSNVEQLDIAYFELAIAQKKAGLAEPAIANFLEIKRESALFVKSRHEVAQSQMAMLYFDPALEALVDAMPAIDNPVERGLNHYLQGKALVGKESYAKAATQFGDALELIEEQKLVESARYSRGVCYMQTAQYAKAEAELATLSEAEDLKVRRAAQRMLGKARIEQNREEEALVNYRALAAEARDPAEKAEYELLLAELLHGLEKNADAAELARKVIDLEFEDTRAEQGNYYLKERAYYLLGDTFVRREMYARAIEAYTEALEFYPSGYYAPDMSFAIASSHMHLGDLEQAAFSFEAFTKSFEADPNVPYAYYYAAYAYFNLTRFEEAAALFIVMERRFAHFDVIPDALYRIGESYFNLGRFDEALTYYQRLLDEHPRSDQADDALYNKAWALLEMDRDADALPVFDELVERFPHSEFSPNAQFSIGDYHYNQESYQEALEAYQKVVKLYPDSPLTNKVPSLIAALRESLAYLDYEKAIEPFREAMKSQDRAKFEQAVVLFQKILEQYPGTESSTGALINMGVSYESLNRWKEALAVYDRVDQAYQQGRTTPEAYQFAKAHREWIAANRL